MARSRQICIYCDRIATTADHVPPKLLFAKPRPSLITVPACRPCNGSASKDDEYLRLVVTVEEKAAEHPEARRVYPAVLRSLQKSTKKGFQKSFVSGIKEINRVTPAGLHIGAAASYDVNLERINGVMERITRGLFLHHIGRRLPTRCIVKSYSSSGFEGAGPDVQRALCQFIEQISTSRVYRIGNDVCCYRFAIAEDEENSSGWLFVLYEAISFLAVTIDSDDSDRVEEVDDA